MHSLGVVIPGASTQPCNSGAGNSFSTFRFTSLGYAVRRPRVGG